MAKNKYVFISAFIASLGGLLFGFDTAVISGAEKQIQQLFELDGFWHGFTVAIALIGTLCGALMAGKPADIFGRKNILKVIALLYIISALGCAFAQTWAGFLIYRFLGGVGVGASSVIGPMYIAEIAPAKVRGRLVAAFQLNIAIGIVLSYFSNYWIANIITHDAWRWMLGIIFIPATIFFILIFLVPESPRWLVLKNKINEAKEVLQRLGSNNLERELTEIEFSVRKIDNVKHENLFSSKYKKPIILAFLVALFNQLSGINAIMYYAPRIFEMVGYAQDSALLQSVSVGVTLLLFTLLGMFLIDRVGRKRLLLIGSVGMVFFMGMVAKTVFSTTYGSIWMLIYLSGFIAFFSFSQGTVIWVFISEIFPNSVRAKGQTFGSMTHWTTTVIISWSFPFISESNMGGWIFVFFSIAMVVQFLIVWKLFPETKGKSLEEIQKEFI